MRMGFLIILAAVLGSCALSWFLLRRSDCYDGLRGKGRWYALISLLAVLSVFCSWSVYPRIANFSVSLSPLASLAVFWLIGQLILLLILLPLTPFFRKGGSAAANEGSRMSRRRFLQGAAAGAPFLSFGLSGAGVYTAEKTMEVRRIELGFANLPPAFDGFTIAQLSDTHVGPYFSQARLAEALRLVERENPDLLAITGDFVDDMTLVETSVAQVDALAEKLPHGACFCWGNHEYFRDLSRIKNALLKSRITLLDNTSRRIDKKGQAIYLAGVDYPWSDSKAATKTRQIFLNWALEDIPPQAFTVLLTHHPDFLQEAFAAQVPLSLAGHTHGGQVKLFGKSFFKFGYRYLEGLYNSGASKGYVHTGTGQWLPFRLGIPPQVALITLRRLSQSEQAVPRS